jgi:hypothetical protein
MGVEFEKALVSCIDDIHIEYVCAFDDGVNSNVVSFYACRRVTRRDRLRRPADGYRTDNGHTYH